MNLFGQTTTLSSRHTVKMAWLRIDRTVRGPLTASCRARGLRLLRRGRDLWISTGARGTSTWIYAWKGRLDILMFHHRQKLVTCSTVSLRTGVMREKKGSVSLEGLVN